MGRKSQLVGKGGEFAVIGELIDKGFAVYTPVADFENIDCIIRTRRGHVDIQIKTRGKQFLWDVQKFKPRDDFFIICYRKSDPGTFWVFPSKVFKKHSNFIKKYNRYRLVLSGRKQDLLARYRNNFRQLKR